MCTIFFLRNVKHASSRAGNILEVVLFIIMHHFFLFKSNPFLLVQRICPLDFSHAWWKTQTPHFLPSTIENFSSSAWAWLLLYISLFLSTIQAHLPHASPPTKTMKESSLLIENKDRVECYIYSDNPIPQWKLCVRLESFQAEKTFKSCNDVDGEHLE